jgi:TniQ
MLPRSLDPLPHESLPGYVLRLAHRLERTPGRVALLTGLARQTRTGGTEHVPASTMLYLDPGTAAEFGRATRLSPAEVAALCMNRYAARYPPLDFAGGDSRRRAGDVARSSPWVSTGSTRYCPACLAGGGTGIEQTHGGGWQQEWRFPVIAACTAHQRMLLYRCDQCGQPAHSSPAALLPRMGDLGLHPAQCRNTVRPPGRWAAQPPACRARLDTPTVPDPAITADVLGRILGQQRRLLDALHPYSDLPDAAARDLTSDLIALGTLITMSWPAAEHLVPAALRTGVDRHVEHARQHVEHRRHGPSRNGVLRPMRQPPADPSACAGLLLAADDLRGRDLRDLRDAIAPMLRQLREREPRALYILQSRTDCSSALRAALRTQRGGFYAVGRTHARPAPSGQRQFAPRHIPAFLPLPFYKRHLAGLHGISAKLLRRAASFKLFEIADGGTWMDAADFFQIPLTTARSTLGLIRRWTTPNLTSFETAVECIARELESSTSLVDYQAHRTAMANWSIPVSHWHTLTRDLVVGTRRGRPASYDDHKRLVASVIVWAHVTEGEYLFAPLVMAEKEVGGSDLRTAVTAIVCRRTPRNVGLTVALTTYAQRLCVITGGSADPGTAI